MFGIGFNFGLSAIEGSTCLISEKVIIKIRRNDTYDGVANPVFEFDVNQNYTGWTGTLSIRHRVTDAVLLSAAITVASSASLTCLLTSDETDFPLLTSAEDFGPHPFDINMVSGSSTDTAVTGIAIITKDITS